jgi:hypothetical protein
MSSFNLSADAPEFIPGVAAAAAPADPTKTLTIDTKSAAGDRKRTLTMRPMAEPRTKSLIEGLGPFNMIGVMVRGYGHGDEDDVSSLPDMGEDILPAGAVEVMDGCHNNDYRLKTILRPILGVEDVDVGDFPKNITEYYWINDGKRDEYPWYVLGGLGNGVYFYYTASCTYSGFECAGGMALYAAKDLQTLYDHGMSEAARLRFASCFDKGTREKLKADAAAARAAHQAYIASQKQARAAAAAARGAKPRVAAPTTYLGMKARMDAGAAALQASFAAGRAAGGGGVSASNSNQRIARGPPVAASAAAAGKK